jgi:hypothetical protein
LPLTVPHTASVTGNTMTLPFSDTLEVPVNFSYPTYKTIAQLVDEASLRAPSPGSSAQGFADERKQKFDANQNDVAAADHSPALGALNTFI